MPLLTLMLASATSMAYSLPATTDSAMPTKKEVLNTCGYKEYYAQHLNFHSHKEQGCNKSMTEYGNFSGKYVDYEIPKGSRSSIWTPKQKTK